MAESAHKYNGNLSVSANLLVSVADHKNFTTKICKNSCCFLFDTKNSMEGNVRPSCEFSLYRTKPENLMNVYHIYPAIRWGFPLSRMTIYNYISPMYFCSNTCFTHPKQKGKNSVLLGNHQKVYTLH